MKKEILSLVILFGIVLFSFSVIAASGDICNDSYNNTGFIINIYHDNDLDGFGAGNATEFCQSNFSEMPNGYAANLLDCNDDDADLGKNLTVYLDRDLDSFGDNNPLQICANVVQPGYSGIPGDCVDTNPFTYPGAIDICNSIDDNCDGKIDENFTDLNNICYVGIGECRNSGIMVCSQNANATFCKGIPKKPSNEICDEKDNDCDGLVDEEGICSMADIIFSVFLPNQSVYNTNNVPINISLVSGFGYKADQMSYIDFSSSKPKETILCKKCISVGSSIKKTINLKEGFHNLVFTAIFNNTEFKNNVSIFVDGKKPRLYLPRIRTKNLINGTFAINYDENNLKQIVLLYENATVVNSNCSSGKKDCIFSVDLSQYNGKDIVYSFKVEDLANNIVQSQPMIAEVDTSPPRIEEVSYPVIGNHVFFRFNITEKNFQDISYYDNSYSKAKWKVLCSVLKNNICEKDIRLSPGDHNVTIRVSDKAGNSVILNV